MSLDGSFTSMSPSGIRLGTSAVTTRGMTERDILTVALFLDRAAKIAVNIQAEYGKKLVNFNASYFINSTRFLFKERL